MAIDQNNRLSKYQGANYGQAAGYGVQDLTSLIASLFSNVAKQTSEPIAAPARALGALSEQPVGSNPAQAMGQAMQKLGPYAEGVKKALKMSGETQASEALMNGVPPEHIEQQAGLSPQMNQGSQGANLNQLLVPPGTPGINSPGMNGISTGDAISPQPNIQGALSSLMNFISKQGQTNNGVYTPGSSFGGFIKESNQDALAGQQMASLQQKSLGQEPLQKGDREKIELESQSKFFDTVLSSDVKPLSGESSKILGNVNSGISQIDQMIGALEKNPNFFKQWATPGNAQGQQLEVMIDDTKDILGRLRSGGVIGAGEEKSFLRQLPKKGVAANFESSKTAMFKLKKLRSLMSDVKNSTQPQDANYSKSIQNALQSGATREQIWRLRKEGKI